MSKLSSNTKACEHQDYHPNIRGLNNFSFFGYTLSAFNLKNDRSCSIRTAGNHFIFLLHPPLHNGTTL